MKEIIKKYAKDLSVGDKIKDDTTGGDSNGKTEN